MSVWTRSEQPTEIHAHPERKAVELQRHTPAEVKFKIKIGNRLELNPGVEAVVANKVRGTRLDARERVALSIGGLPVGGALRPGGTAKDPANDRLRAPWSHIVRRSGQAERAGVEFRATFKLRVVTESNNGR